MRRVASGASFITARVPVHRADQVAACQAGWTVGWEADYWAEEVACRRAGQGAGWVAGRVAGKRVSWVAASWVG